jgi:hypothetical protein
MPVPKLNNSLLFGAFLTILLVVFLALFFPVLEPSNVLFSNDGPLGAANAACFRPPSSFLGIWYDLTSIGTAAGSYPLSLTGILFWVLGPLYYSKVYAPLTLIFLGTSAWFFFRKLRLAPLACGLGGLAAALNSSFFSASCWGVGTHAVTVGASYLAMGLLVDQTARFRLVKTALAGLMVGFGVTEGADIGALFSMAVAAFVIYRAWFGQGAPAVRVGKGVLSVAVVACFAVLFAAQAVTTLIGTQIQGIAGTQQDSQTKQQHWDFATQWSLPKREALGFAVPGLFGYRMDRADGGAYWGAVGRDPNWDRYFAEGKQGPAPGGSMRFSGGGIYTGILVILAAAWAAAQSFRGRNSLLSQEARRNIWFLLVVFLVSLLLAFGRFAPFYQFFYALPYFSTIRNPAKFCYFCNWALVILFGYGVDGLYRTYLAKPGGKGKVVRQSVGEWWRSVRGFDRRWTFVCAAVLAGCALGWLVFASSSDAFIAYLQEVQFESAMAALIQKFTVGQIGVFLLFFAGAVCLVTLIISGVMRGDRAKWAGALLGLLLVVDLGRANLPWIITWDYKQKYASNPIIDELRKTPYEHRVAGLPRWLAQVFRFPAGLGEAEQYFRQLYGIEWTQHHFLYYNIQSLDVIQMPRMPEDLASFEADFMPASAADLPKITRHWQLTNTRYLLGAAGFLDLLNQQFDPVQRRFRIAQRFDIVPKPGIDRPTKLEELTATVNTNGAFALFELTGVLPRAGLYSNWQIATNNEATLQALASPSFDPINTVLVGSGVSPALPTASKQAGEVEFSSYAPKEIVLNATAATRSILLLNDRLDKGWKVFVDGQEHPLLRCNFIMRGVELGVGQHKVEFRFAPARNAFYVSLTAVGLSILFWTILLAKSKYPDTPDTNSVVKLSESAAIEG